MMRTCGHVRVLCVRPQVNPPSPLLDARCPPSARGYASPPRSRARGRWITGACVASRRDRVEIASGARRARANCVWKKRACSGRAFAFAFAFAFVVAREQQQQTDGVMPRSRFVRAHAQVDASRARDCVAVRRGAGGARRVERAVSRRATRARAV